MWEHATRAIAAVLAIALCSCWVQLDAFGSSRGLSPVSVRLARYRLHCSCSLLGAMRTQPTVFWFGCSDAALHAWTALGVGMALMAVWGGAGSRVCILLANLIFLSLDVCFDLSMPWDCLLLEAGWLCALLPAPTPLLDGSIAPEPVHPAAAFLIRWLLFRLMFGFGKLKFCGTAATDKLYVRDFMIAQPMPSKLGWAAHYFPLPVYRVLLGGMFFTEMIAPFLLFIPHWVRAATDARLVAVRALCRTSPLAAAPRHRKPPPSWRPRSSSPCKPASSHTAHSATSTC
jgi:hypothetical protein